MYNDDWLCCFENDRCGREGLQLWLSVFLLQNYQRLMSNMVIFYNMHFKSTSCKFSLNLKILCDIFFN